MTNPETSDPAGATAPTEVPAGQDLDDAAALEADGSGIEQIARPAEEGEARLRETEEREPYPTEGVEALDSTTGRADTTRG